MSFLRHVLLQDLALLLVVQPKLPLWDQPAIKVIIFYPKWPRSQAWVKVTHESHDPDDIYVFKHVCSRARELPCLVVIRQLQ